MASCCQCHSFAGLLKADGSLDGSVQSSWGYLLLLSGRRARACRMMEWNQVMNEWVHVWSDTLSEECLHVLWTISGHLCLFLRISLVLEENLQRLACWRMSQSRLWPWLSSAWGRHRHTKAAQLNISRKKSQSRFIPAEILFFMGMILWDFHLGHLAARKWQRSCDLMIQMMSGGKSTHCVRSTVLQTT